MSVAARFLERSGRRWRNNFDFDAVWIWLGTCYALLAAASALQSQPLEENVQCNSHSRKDPPSAKVALKF